MTLKRTIIAGLAMLLLYLPLHGNITTTIKGQSITVTSSQQGQAGLHGCNPTSAKKAEAYVFQLQTKPKNIGGTCAAPKAGQWTIQSEKPSNDGTITFNNLPDGKYRIICLSGEAIGCEIAGTTDRSIVYRKEVSQVVDLGAALQNDLSAITKVSQANTELLVYPNPASNEINVQLQSQTLDGPLQMELFDMLGKQVLTKTATYTKGAQQTWQLDTQTFSSGTYLIKLTDDTQQARYCKVIIEHKQ